jgi:hypothetical protein
MFCHRPTWSNPYQPYPWRIGRWNPGTKSALPGKRSARGAHSIRMSLLSLLSTNRRTMGKERLEISGRLETQYSGFWRGSPLPLGVREIEFWAGFFRKNKRTNKFPREERPVEHK